MIKLKQILNEDINDIIGYHITRRIFLKSIRKNGLIPHVPQDFGPEGDENGIYFFPNLDETKNALYNWLGERIDEWEEETNEKYDEICLKVDLSDVRNMKKTLDWEIVVFEKIPSNKILDVIEI